MKRNIEVISRDKLDQAGAYFNQIRHPIVRMYSWAKLLSDLGTDIVAVDNGADLNAQLSPSHFWLNPIRGDEKLIEQYPDRTLFLCWPDPRSQMASKALVKYSGKYLIYIGYPNPYPAAMRSLYMGDFDFYDMLHKQFKLIKMVNIPQWPGNNDALYVYERH